MSKFCMRFCSQNSALHKLQTNEYKPVQGELCWQPSKALCSFPNSCVFCHAAHCPNRRRAGTDSQGHQRGKLHCAMSCTLICFSLWEEASAAGAGLVVSAFAASQNWLPFPAALEAQVEISFAVKPGHSEAFKHRNLLGLCSLNGIARLGGQGVPTLFLPQLWSIGT